MDSSQETAAPRPLLRVWPAVVLVLAQWLSRFVIPAFWADALYFGVMAGVLGGLALALWWTFFSRAPWSERLSALAAMAVALFVTSRLLHVSVATGMMGLMFPIYVIPTLSLGFAAWAVMSGRLPQGLRHGALIASILIGCLPWTLVRTGGFSAGLDHDFAWRWAKTPEERLLALGDDAPAVIPPALAPDAASSPSLPPSQADGMAPSPMSTPGATTASTNPPVKEKGAVWPGFRGPGRDGVLHDAQVQTDWAAVPPTELWRRPIGPGWSSFAVDGDAFYTQEQRGDDEVVTAYRLSTGAPLWRHRDTARFWESNGGAGPRGTPTLSGGRIYSLGATGILNALDARTGSLAWSRNAATDSGAALPDWGFSSSPLVVGDLVLVATSGVLAAYDAATGAPRWMGPKGGAGYSSPQLATIDGESQVLQLSDKGVMGVRPEDGTLLWEHPWKGYPIVQPAVTGDGDVLIAVADSSGVRRLSVRRSAAGWSASERWTSTGLKPYFNDFVVHKGHAYGFDGSILACIDLTDGRRVWKGGRYGNGQLVLLADQNALLVLSERGELALVGATPDQFTELARIKAIEGKTWNHPVLAGDVLLVRNGEEMAAYRLSRPASPRP